MTKQNITNIIISILRGNSWNYPPKTPKEHTLIVVEIDFEKYKQSTEYQNSQASIFSDTHFYTGKYVDNYGYLIYGLYDWKDIDPVYIKRWRYLKH